MTLALALKRLLAFRLAAAPPGQFLALKLCSMLCLGLIGAASGIALAAFQVNFSWLFVCSVTGLLGALFGAVFGGGRVGLIGWSFVIATFGGTIVGLCLSTPKTHLELEGACAGALVGLLLMVLCTGVKLWYRANP